MAQDGAKRIPVRLKPARFAPILAVGAAPATAAELARVFAAG
jgi:hypothetical protein